MLEPVALLFWASDRGACLAPQVSFSLRRPLPPPAHPGRNRNACESREARHGRALLPWVFILYLIHLVLFRMLCFPSRQRIEAMRSGLNVGQ